jgi:hypothetical protein
VVGVGPGRSYLQGRLALFVLPGRMDCAAKLLPDADFRVDFPAPGSREEESPCRARNGLYVVASPSLRI